MIEDIKEIVRRREEAAKSLSRSLRHLTTEQAYYILTSTMSVEALEEFARVQSQLVEALRKIAQQKTSSELGSDEQYADFRCADSRAEQLRKERDEALEVLMRLVVAYDGPSYPQVMPDAAPAWTEARKILNKYPKTGGVNSGPKQGDVNA